MTCVTSRSLYAFLTQSRQRNDNILSLFQLENKIANEITQDYDTFPESVDSFSVINIHNRFFSYFSSQRGGYPPNLTLPESAPAHVQTKIKQFYAEKHFSKKKF